ncbi:MAG: SRPBCC domain-containing protein [Balneolaceae bacterium]|nr:SRPBCC domain-containing protein [Balneolaceae bacterium]MBO6648830.1 SRPBCC domain-containing protein [Balneolaceae bacterium]
MTNTNQLIITREFEAPVELLWEVHSKPEHIERWFGPAEMYTNVLDMDFRPGGSLFYSIGNEQGKMFGLVKYTEIQQPSKMIYINSFADENRNIIRHPMSDTWPLEVHNTLVFEALGNKSKLIVTSVPIKASEEEIDTYRNSHGMVEQGMGGMFKQLDDYLETVTS